MTNNDSEESLSLDVKEWQAQKGLYEQHIFDSYFNLRTGIAILAILLPVLLLIGGYLIEGNLRRSMSHYYHEETMRDWFVGILWAIGVFLILYKGWTGKQVKGLNENWALNLAGLCALGVAMVPTASSTSVKEYLTLHDTFAVTLFLLMFYVCRFRAKDTLDELKDGKIRNRFIKAYNRLGALMLWTPIIAYLMAVVVGEFWPRLAGINNYVFIVEAMGIFFFASYWLTKTMELSLSGLERKLPARTPKVLTVDKSHDVVVDPGVLNYPTGVLVEKGAKYKFQASGKWIDWFIQCGPEGWGNQCFLKRFNRKRGEPFFLLCGNVGKSDEKDASFCIGGKREWGVPDTVEDLGDRQLYLFANDIPIAYGNNRQHPRTPLTVTITRL